MVVTGPESFGENGGFVGLDPSIHRLSSLDGGRLVPFSHNARARLRAGPRGTHGRDQLNPVLAHGQVFDQGLPIGIGVNAAGAHLGDHRSTIHHEGILGPGRGELVGGSQWVAKGVGHDRASQDILQHHHEPSQAGLPGVRNVVDRGVVMKSQDGNLRRRDGVDVQDHINRRLRYLHLPPTHFEAIGQNRNQVAAARITNHLSQTICTAAGCHQRGVAFVNLQRRTIQARLSRNGDSCIIFFENPSKFGDRFTTTVFHVESKIRLARVSAQPCDQ